MAAANLHRDTVVYQIYPRSYMDSNGDGIGDINGIISKLDYLADLGINTIWFSPLYKSPDDDNGYDIADYKSIDPKFGTMEEFDTLLAEAKKRGIGIVMDLVINHTSDEHEWFRKAMAGDEKYRNYYIIRKGKNGKLPNNWGNFFAECPWSKFGGEDSEEYYLHLFSKKQPDLNWHNPAVLEEVKDIMRFWLEKGVVGFRCDVINIIYKDSLENGKPSPILTGMEHYLSTEGCHRILRELHDEVLEPYGAFTVGETVFVDIHKARDLIDEKRRELDMIFYFEHMETDQVIVKWFKTQLKPKKLMECLTKWQLALDWCAVYFENHDQPRFISRFIDSKGFRKESSKMMAGLLMTLRGTPFMYEGQEIGMTNGDFANLDEVMDIESHNVYKMATNLHLPKAIRWKMIQRTSRDNARTPMQWNADANAGFTTGKPWLKVNGNYTEVNVEKDMADEDGVRAFWKKMIQLRKTSEILREGQFRSCLESKSVYAFKRVLDGKELLSVCNMTGKTVAVPEKIKDWDNVVVSSYKDYKTDVLKPFEFRLVKKG
ncbi:MAG: alpha-glucosidase [Oscillospiraceae bacterium]|nr:alpha-glucosidase [Oscillospiraceae bacterium]